MSEAKQDQEFLEPEYAKNEQKKHEYPWYLENIEKYLTPEVSSPVKLSTLFQIT